MRALVETVVVDGCSLRLRTMAPAGRSQDQFGTTVVLVHGIGMSHRSFRRLQAVLSRTYRTVAVDLPGFGGLPTPPPGRRLGIGDLADLVGRALRQCGVLACVAIGQSMGSQIVTAMARADPTFATSVALIGPVVDERRRSIHQQLGGLVLDSRQESLRMNLVVFSDYLRSIPAYLRVLPSMLRYPMLRAVGGLAVPVLVLRGTADPIADHDWARRLSGITDQGVLIELPGAHHVQEDVPAAVAGVIDEFIRVQPVGRL